MHTTLPGQKSMQRTREKIFRVMLVVASVVGTLFLTEIVLRITTPREVMRYFFMTSDPVLNHRFVQNATGRYQTTEFDTHYKINSAGLRDREFARGKHPGTFRILMLGDSFTEGDGVESNQTFSKLIEAHLDSTIVGMHCEVINAGVGSYSTILYYLYLTHQGLAFDPDLVVVNFDLSDVYDDIQYTQKATFDDKGVPLAVGPDKPEPEHSFLMGALVGIKDFFKDHTRLYNFIRLRIDRYLEGVRHEGNFSGDIRYDKYAMLRENYSGVGNSDWKLSFHYLDLIKQVLQSRNIGLWVAVYPYGLQVSPREWDSGRKFWGFTPDTLYNTFPQHYLVEYCDSVGIPAINTFADFKEAAQQQFPLYYDYNGHWRPEGQKVFAHAIERVLDPYLRKLVPQSIHRSVAQNAND